MPRSMTGHGQARLSDEFGIFKAELRSVNNRGLKLQCRLPETLAHLEHRIDRQIRRRLHRGSVQVRIDWRRTDVVSQYQIDQGVLGSYFRQLNQLRVQYDAAAIDLTQLAGLPGVVVENDDDGPVVEGLEATIEELLDVALDSLDEMRRQEGEAMAETLQREVTGMQQRLQRIEQRAPQVVDAYRDRLQVRIEKLLAERGIDVAAVDILREVQLFADRCDISEETTRLGTHLSSFARNLAEDGPVGRRLDFVIQEIGRETNTIGSKANDSEIATEVVELKCAIERMRELVQNIE